MIKVFPAAWSVATRFDGVRAGLIVVLGWAWLGAEPSVALAQAPSADAEQKAAEAKSADDAPDTSRPEDDEVKETVDPSESHKAATLEVYKDPNAEAARDPKKFSEIRTQRAPLQQEIDQVKMMAPNPVAAVDVNTITNVVNGMVAQMTNTRNIQAIVDAGAEQNPRIAQQIQIATQNLLEPVFTSRAAKNAQFQTRYNQVLLQKLPPVLKNHLIPRIQAMIILAESANPEALKVFLDEIKNPTQTVWVKLWAFRGITNIKLHNNRLSTSQESDAAKVIADELKKSKDWPWFVQFRGLEALAALRQGFMPTSPRTADMAAVAFDYLADESLHPEVRAQAALALGSMQITQAVPRFNFELAAYASADLGADVIQRILDSFSENKTRAQKLTTIVVGPLHQAFMGREGIRESGLLNNPAAPNRNELKKYFDAMAPSAKAAAALIGAPTGQIPALTKDLGDKLTVFQDFLAKNRPAETTLFPGGPSLPAPAGAEAAQAPTAPGAAVAEARR